MKLSLSTEKKFLQVIIALACLVPLGAGLMGVLQGLKLSESSLELDNHFRYLSGLLLGIGICFASTIPHTEKHSQRFKILTIIVVIGGVCRFLGFLLCGVATKTIIMPLIMELVITPLLYFWQYSLANRYSKTL